MSRWCFNHDRIGVIATLGRPVSSPLTSPRPFHIHTWLFRRTLDRDGRETG